MIPASCTDNVALAASTETPKAHMLPSAEGCTGT